MWYVVDAWHTHPSLLWLISEISICLTIEIWIIKVSHLTMLCSIVSQLEAQYTSSQAAHVTAYMRSKHKSWLDWLVFDTWSLKKRKKKNCDIILKCCTSIIPRKVRDIFIELMINVVSMNVLTVLGPPPDMTIYAPTRDESVNEILEWFMCAWVCEMKNLHFTSVQNRLELIGPIRMW